MGYYSSVYGDVDFTRKVAEVKEEIAVERAALAEQLRALGGIVDFDDEDIPKEFLKALRNKDVFDAINYGFEVQDEGLVAEGESGKFYDLEDEVRAMASLAEKHDVFTNGIITVTGEEAGDIWRLVIKDNTVTREETKVIWPDGTEYKP